MHSHAEREKSITLKVIVAFSLDNRILGLIKVRCSRSNEKFVLLIIYSDYFSKFFLQLHIAAIVPYDKIFLPTQPQILSSIYLPERRTFPPCIAEVISRRSEREGTNDERCNGEVSRDTSFFSRKNYSFIYMSQLQASFQHIRRVA